MNKPLNLLLEEEKEKIVQVINQTKLPAFLLEPIIKEIYMQISELKKRELEESVKKYEESKIEENKKGEE